MDRQGHASSNYSDSSFHFLQGIKDDTHYTVLVSSFSFPLQFPSLLITIMSARKRSLRSNGAVKTTEKEDYPKTDYSRWRLLDVRGRQTWHYLNTDAEMKKWPQNIADRYHLGLETVRILFSSSNGLTADILRISPICHHPKDHLTAPKMATLSICINSLSLETGAVDMMGQCSCCRAWSSHCISPTCL